MDLSEAVKIRNPNQLTRHPWETTRLKIITSLLKKQKGFPFNHIIDIGSGDGFILQNLLQEDAARKFSSVDTGFNDVLINKMKIWAGSSKLHFYKNINEIKNDGETKACVLLLDVLEHVPDEEKLIMEIFQYARIEIDTTWLITVPAFQSLFSDHDKQLKHYRRYNLKQLLNLCKKSGLKIDQSGYFFFSLIPLRIFQNILFKFSSKENINTIENWKGGNTISTIIKAALWIDFRICLWFSRLRINIPGLSCYCICH